MIKPYVHQVQYYETDRMQVTHHSNYIRFMEEARLDFLRQIGWGYEIMEENGIISPVISVTCDYKKTTTFADQISIRVDITEFRGVKLKLSYTMTCGNQVVCTATSGHCFLTPEGRPINMKKEYPKFYETIQTFLEDVSK